MLTMAVPAGAVSLAGEAMLAHFALAPADREGDEAPIVAEKPP